MDDPDFDPVMSPGRDERLSNLLDFIQKRSQESKRKAPSLPDAAEVAPGPDPVPDSAAPPKSKKAKTVSKPTAKSADVRSSSLKRLLPAYSFANDSTIPELDLSLRPNIEVRPYQNEALNAIVDHSVPEADRVARSGIIVLPCGAGKTLTSILVACAIRKPVLVVCSTIIAAEQFNREFLRFSTLMASKTGMFAGSKKWPYNGPSGVLFTTYTMLVDNKNRSADSKRMSNFIANTQFGLVILDEVHCVPANNFSKAIANIKTRVRLGLTATMLREDEKIGDLETLVGPTLYHAKWKELADRGYIAKVACTQVESAMVPVFKEAYDALPVSGAGSNSVLGHVHHMKSLLSILNPKKMQLCQRLVQFHEARGDKVLVFCDHIDALKIYAEKLNRPFIYGGTSPDVSRDLLQRFQIEIPKLPEDATWSQQAAQRRLKGKVINTLLLSRIGDTSLDLPAATVLIQVSSHFGSRRQEAQRLGRVLRAKNRNEKGFYSRFYTLVTTETHETSFSEKRRTFLEEDCGYGYQIWKVGDEDPEGGGWFLEEGPGEGGPADDTVMTDPITCSITGEFARPYATPTEQHQLVNFLRSLKKIDVEDDEQSIN
ncbi:P-loop containing nucleoside triphosphate hydrolase protein [Dichotomocladium elegans]|nr:P-loop containing nucleoside triphosphate hydrolase protein [Dichotomocladium elegans]